MRILASPIPSPKGGRFARFTQEVDWLRQDVSWETLEDLPPREAAAQITLWIVRWRRLEAQLRGDAPEDVHGPFRQVLGLILEGVRRYPGGRLPRIPVLDREASTEFTRECDRARDLLAEEEMRRSGGGWREDLLEIARDLGIEPLPTPLRGRHCRIRLSKPLGPVPGEG